MFGPDLKAIPDPIRARGKRGAKFICNVFCPAIGEKPYHCWPYLCSRLNLKVEVPLAITEVLQKPISRSGV